MSKRFVLIKGYTLLQFWIGLIGLLVLLFCFSCQPEPAKITQPEAVVRHLSDFEPSINKWGFIDRTGQPVIEAQFDDVRPFTEGLAAVNLDGLWGYITPSGHQVISPIFIKAHNFVGGVARVRGSNGKMGLIVPNGDTVAPFSFDEIYPSIFDKCVIEINFKKGVLNKNGDVLIEPSFEEVVLLTDELYAISSENEFEVRSFETGGNVLIVEAVAAGGYIKQNGMWGKLNQIGDWVVRPTFNAIWEGGPHHSIVQQKDSFGILNHSSGLVEWVSNVALRHLGDGRYTYRSSNGWRLVSEEGSVIRNLPVNSIYSYREGIAAVEVDGWWGYIDRNGTVMVQPMFVLPWVSHEGLLRLFTREGFGFHDHDGRVVIQPKFKDVRDFSESLAAYQE